MAKSIRSKRKRAMRAIKRERYGKKELARLVNTLKNGEKEEEKNDMDVESLVTVTDAKTVIENKNKEDAEKTEEMEHSQKRVFNKKTMTDQHGNYPIWLGSKKKKAHIKVNQKKKKQLKQKEKKKQKNMK